MSEPSPLERLMDRAKRFLRVEAASGVLLMSATAIALAWANSPWREGYRHLWERLVATRSLHFWINDALMTLFFFVVGLEIRLELHAGTLARVRQAMLPVFAALGGMLAPAIIYLAIAYQVAPRGWAVPIATDIAFAVGVLGLLGPRVPDSLRVLLLALAVVDDLGAIVVIALFYTGHFAIGGCVLAGAACLGVLALQRAGVRTAWGYVAPALALWLGLAQAGVHPTMAGVLLGLMTPTRAIDGETQAPVESWIERLHPWVSHLVMPLFALANAGVDLGGVILDDNGWRIASGVALGLALGKPLGIVSASGLARALRLADVGEDVTSGGLVLVGVVGGIGFTMAIFIAELAFADSPYLPVAKAAVVVGSSAAALMGAIYGLIARRRIGQQR